MYELTESDRTEVRLSLVTRRDALRTEGDRLEKLGRREMATSLRSDAEHLEANIIPVFSEQLPFDLGVDVTGVADTPPAPKAKASVTQKQIGPPKKAKRAKKSVLRPAPKPSAKKKSKRGKKS